MKRNVTQELRDMRVEEIEEQIEECRRALFSLRLNATTSHVKDFSQFKKLRRTIARGLTVLREKQGVQSNYKEHANE